MTAFYGPDFGGPSAAIVHQDRLVLVGNGAVADLLMASRTRSWTDFRLGLVRGTTPVTDVARQVGPADDFVATDADGFFFQSSSARGNELHALLQQEGLFVLGSIGESVVPPTEFTAARVQLRENSWYGSDLGRTPIIAGGQVIFLQAGGSDIRSIFWNEAQAKYLAPSLLSLSGSVFAHGRDMTFQGSNDVHGDTVFVIDEDGALAVVLLKVGEPAPAWSQWDTDGGRVLGGASPSNALVFAVERGGAVALETLEPATGERDFDVWMVEDNLGSDESGNALLPDPLQPSRPNVLAERGIDLDALDDEGRSVEWTWLIERPGEVDPRPVSGDGAALRAALRDEVTDSDQVEIAPRTRVSIGRSFDRVVQTVPFVRQTASGPARSLRRVRILECAVDYVVRGPTSEESEVDLLLEACGEATMRTLAQRNGRDASDRRGRTGRRNVRRARDITDEMVSVQYKMAGWRDRIALECRSRRHVEIAGASYKAIS